LAINGGIGVEEIQQQILPEMGDRRLPSLYPLEPLPPFLHQRSEGPPFMLPLGLCGARKPPMLRYGLPDALNSVRRLCPGAQPAMKRQSRLLYFLH
jgi:hypothetical protein